MSNGLRIAIIGGGPSGLLLARLLELEGFTDYTVFERDASGLPGPHQQGGTLDLHERSGQHALKRAGLFDEFSNHLARWDASCVHILDQDGITFMRRKSGSRPEIDRTQLRQLLLNSIPPERLRWNHRVRLIEKTDSERSHDTSANGFTIHFDNGSTAAGFDLIVGADGAWSKVRPLITTTRPTYSGKMFIEGRISPQNPAYPSAQDIAGPGNSMALGKAKNLNVQQMADTSYRVYFGLQVPEDFYSCQPKSDSLAQTAGVRDCDADTLRQRLLGPSFFGDWAPQLKLFVEEAESPFRQWPLHRFDPDEVKWDRSAASGVTLLGDAAHCSTPFAGEGVNCSLLDAVVLADALIRHCGKETHSDVDLSTAIDTALAEYEANMFDRGQSLIRKSMQIEEVVYRDNAAEELLAYFKRMMGVRS